jgi:hypothetical protein
MKRPVSGVRRAGTTAPQGRGDSARKRRREFGRGSRVAPAPSFFPASSNSSLMQSELSISLMREGAELPPLAEGATRARAGTHRSGPPPLELLRLREGQRGEVYAAGDRGRAAECGRGGQHEHEQDRVQFHAGESTRWT